MGGVWQRLTLGVNQLARCQIPLVVGPNMNSHEDQHHWSLSLLVTVLCASVLLLLQ